MNDDALARPEIPCPVCNVRLDLRPTRGRKSGKPSLMFICPVSRTHFHGFINDQDFVFRVLRLFESQRTGDEDPR